MGRYLAASIPTQLFIKKKSERFANLDLVKDKEKILNQINKYIDLSFYDIEGNEEQIHLKLIEEKANKYLKELLEEINPILDLDYYLQYCLFDREDNAKLQYDNIVIKKDIKPNDIDYYMTAGKHKCEIEEDWACTDGAPWLFDLEDEFKLIGVRMFSIHIWLDFPKYFGENENKMLLLLNKFSKNYFKSELSKVMIFNIFG